MQSQGGPVSTEAPTAASREPPLSAPDEDLAWYEENTMVAVHLQCIDHPTVEAWFGTYHMPCAFTQPKLMAMHSSMAMQHLQQLAATSSTGAGHGSTAHGSTPCSTPCLLGGDWNLKPTDPMYTLLTSGSMDPRLTDFYPCPPAADSWVPTLSCGMASAYATANGGREPNFTNYVS